MKQRFWILWCLLVVAGVCLFWPRGTAPAPKPVVTKAIARPVATAPIFAGTNQVVAGATRLSSVNGSNRFAYRLANTPKTIGQLTHDPHAILLANAFIETDLKTALAIPTHLRAGSEPGAFIVQAHGVITAAFRAALAGAGGQIVSYLPNNAYLVQLTAASAAALAGNPLVQAVLPYEPYYKVQNSLLAAAVNQQPLPAGMNLTLGLYASSAAATETQITQLGAKIVARDRSPFGPIVRVRPPADWLALAQLPGVQIVEPVHRRKAANDLARPSVGMSPTYYSPVANDYLGLTGSNVTVAVIDSGVDATHPDLTNRVLQGSVNANFDTDGHGTHVAGIIAGDGTQSTNKNITFEEGVSFWGKPNQYRGKARLAKLYSVNYNDIYDIYFDYFFYYSSDQYLQEAPALANALISNNSWNYTYSSEYDLAAASYDAAVRDAVPEMTGPQPVLFVFSAGNDGEGNDSGVGGYADSILSPATAKDVITVGALEQLRNVTNWVTALNGTSNQYWLLATDSSNQVASYSSRGNVGVGTEGTYGRFKPDVVAPGSFVVSTRSQQWDTNTYYNAIHSHQYSVSPYEYVDTNLYNIYQLPVPGNATAISLQILANGLSPSPFPKLKMVVSITNTSPDPSITNSYDFSTLNNAVNIPTPNGGSNYLQAAITNGYLYFAIADTTNTSVEYTLVENITTFNDFGNIQTVLAGMNDQLGPYYRYESGTSMAAPAVAGVLALMQDYFTNRLSLTPSPALLKALLINGARSAWPGTYGYAVNSGVNEEGWGLINLPNSLPASLSSSNTATPLFFTDQNPTNLLATGDSRTYTVAVTQDQPLRITLAWTDPPGNPAAASKLVNNLNLIVTNLNTGQIYYGNSFDTSDQPLSLPYTTNDAPVLDAINNVQNVVIVPGVGGARYSVTVVGQSVNVNAVTTAQTNTVQDYALVIACDDSGNFKDLTVAGPVAASSSYPLVSSVAAANQISFSQTAGANAPLANTNFIYFGTNSAGYATNAVLYLGTTNQWRFYVATNTTGYTNAAFVVFNPYTLSLQREEVFDYWYEWYYYWYFGFNNANPLEADLDIYVATESGLTNLNAQVLSNCLSGLNGDSAMVDRGGTAYVAFTNSAAGNVYYIGVKCESQMGAQYGFVGAFSKNPFSTLDADGNEYVNAFNVPLVIPDGDNAHPGVGLVLGLALYPITPRNVVVSNTVTHQNFGDLVGILSHDETYAILNNHDGYGPLNQQTLVYDDSLFISPTNVNSMFTNTNSSSNTNNNGSYTNVLKSDGPGGLTYFDNKAGAGLWMLTEIDDSLTQTGHVDNLTLKIEPHNPGTNGLHVYLWGEYGILDYIYVPPGYTNLTVVATNFTGTVTPAVQLQLEPPNGNFINVNLDQGTPPGNSISYGPPLPPGFYWVWIFNPSLTPVDVFWSYKLSYDPAAILKADYLSQDTPLPIADDALTVSPLAMTSWGLTNSTIFVPDDNSIVNVNVGIRVDHPRISDLTFTLIDPYGFRYLLMENRGSTSTNGCGVNVIMTNIFVAVPASGGSQPQTNFYNVGMTSGTLPITHNFYIAPDEMTIYYGTNSANFYPGSPDYISDTGFISNPPIPPYTTNNAGLNTYPETFTITYPPPGDTNTSTWVTIIMNQFGNPSPSTVWTYTAGGVFTNYEYLTFTEDPSLATTPIKFAPVPFVSDPSGPPTNIYYQAEQSLAPLVTESTFGWWQLEVLDNRAGATNPPPTILSWRLEFEYANPNYIAYYPWLSGFSSQTNTIATNSFQWYQVNVPTNSNLGFATNILDYASAPVNLWFSINYPATPDTQLLTNSTGGIGSPVLTTNGTPLLVPGSTYYLGVQNTNSFIVTNVVEVDFDHGNPQPGRGPASVHFRSVPSSSSNLNLAWDAASGSYQIQWKDNLTDAWNTLTNPITVTSNGVSIFTDTGAQTAPLGTQRYYRLVWMP